MSVKYELIIYGRESDRAFIVEVPELPGCRLDGQTYVEAVTNAEVVIREWSETPLFLTAIASNDVISINNYYDRNYRYYYQRKKT